jgi:hypothetical protein
LAGILCASALDKLVSPVPTLSPRLRQNSGSSSSAADLQTLLNPPLFPLLNRYICVFSIPQLCLGLICCCARIPVPPHPQQSGDTRSRRHHHHQHKYRSVSQARWSRRACRAQMRTVYPPSDLQTLLNPPLFPLLNRYICVFSIPQPRLRQNSGSSSSAAVWGYSLPPPPPPPT